MQRFGCTRLQAKTINFGTIYGQGAFALSRMLAIPQDEAKAFIAEYFRRFAGVRSRSWSPEGQRIATRSSTSTSKS